MEQAHMNIRQLLESRVRQHPDKAFLIFEDQITSYADFDTTVNRVANRFLRLGISAGDRVCVMLSNCPEFLYAWFGLMKIGAILVPINSAFRLIQKRSILCSMRKLQPSLWMPQQVRWWRTLPRSSRVSASAFPWPPHPRPAKSPGAMCWPGHQQPRQWSMSTPTMWPALFIPLARPASRKA